MSSSKKKLLVSFSGGETSAFMSYWLWVNKRHEYEMIFVFANTGQENEETLLFIQRFEAEFSIPVRWIEAVVDPQHGIGNSFEVVDFKSADRIGRVFESVIAKHGIPNSNFPHCTRELKERPIKAYARSLGWKNYYTAIGIREDEADRINAKAIENRFIYPMVSSQMRPMTKQKINFWWSHQKFRLGLKGYQGNCKWCWKKSIYKHFQLVRENPHVFDFPREMEQKYGTYIPETRLNKMKARGELPVFPINFFRKNRSTNEMLIEAIDWNGSVEDNSLETDDSFDLLGGESCEVYSECGS